MNFKYYKLFKLLLICSFLVPLTGCDNTLTIESEPELNVTLAKTEYKVGEEVVFQIQGNSDIVSFYSGEISNNYDYREGRILDLGSYGAKMSFTSAVQGGDQADQVSVMISSDFNGVYNLDEISKANWTELTPQFILGTNATFVSSNEVDVSSAIKKDKPIYIGFKYKNQPQAVNGLGRTWMFQNIQLQSKAIINGSSPIIANHSQLAFQIVDPHLESTPSRSVTTGTRLSLLGNAYKDPKDPIYDPENPIYNPENPIYDPKSSQYDPNAIVPEFKPYDPLDPTNDPNTEHWAISQGIVVSTLDLGPDWSIPIKGLRSVIPESFKYSYSMPGIYKVRFIALNATTDQAKSIIRELTITITE